MFDGLDLGAEFQGGMDLLVRTLGGGHTLTLQRYVTDPTALGPAETPEGDPITARYTLGTYEKDNKDGVPAGTARLSIAAVSVEGHDLSKDRWEIVSTSNGAVISPLELAEIQGFKPQYGGGAVALWTLPVVLG